MRQQHSTNISYIHLPRGERPQNWIIPRALISCWESSGVDQQITAPHFILIIFFFCLIGFRSFPYTACVELQSFLIEIEDRKVLLETHHHGCYLYFGVRRSLDWSHLEIHYLSCIHLTFGKDPKCTLVFSIFSYLDSVSEISMSGKQDCSCATQTSGSLDSIRSKWALY